MSDYSSVEILIVEDNAEDAELMVRALKKHNLANQLYIVEDGGEALDFLFSRKGYALRHAPENRSDIPGPETAQIERIGGAEAVRKTSGRKKSRSSSSPHPVRIPTSGPPTNWAPTATW